MISEMIHSASLIHDDVIDQSNFRRGKPSVNVLWNHRKVIKLNWITQTCYCISIYIESSEQWPEKWGRSSMITWAKITHVLNLWICGQIKKEYITLCSRLRTILIHGSRNSAATYLSGRTSHFIIDFSLCISDFVASKTKLKSINSLRNNNKCCDQSLLSPTSLQQQFCGFYDAHASCNRITKQKLTSIL